MPARSLLVAAFALALAAPACKTSEGEASPAAPATVTAAHPVTSCPLGLPGATITAQETAEGMDLVVLGPTDHLEELRQRVRDAAGLYGVGAHRGLGHDGGHHLGTNMHGLRLTELPFLETHVDDIEGGARLELRAKVPAQTEDLQRQLRARVDEVTSAPCD